MSPPETRRGRGRTLVEAGDALLCERLLGDVERAGELALGRRLRPRLDRIPASVAASAIGLSGRGQQRLNLHCGTRGECVKRKGLGTDSGWPTTTWAAPPAEPASRLSIRSAWLDRAGGGGGGGGAKAAIEGAVGEEAEAIAQEIEGGAVEGVGGKGTSWRKRRSCPRAQARRMACGRPECQ